jgi:hypothetical protein
MVYHASPGGRQVRSPAPARARAPRQAGVFGSGAVDRTKDTPVQLVLSRLEWMRAQRIWPNGLRYLWTDAFGVVLLLSLAEELGEPQRVAEAEAVVAEVERVLGRPRGLRIGEEPDRDGQYFHYLAMWLFALQRLAQVRPAYRERALELVRAIHPRFVAPGLGVHWKMLEDLSAPYPGFGLGGLDPLHGWVVYRLLDAGSGELAAEIADMERLSARLWPSLHVTQDLGLGMVLWFTHFFPEEAWARALKPRALAMLDTMWIDPPGYFCREPGARHVRFAFTNHGVAIGLQAVGAWPGRVAAQQQHFETWRSGDEYDSNAITHVMACCSRLPGLLLQRPARAAT